MHTHILSPATSQAPSHAVVHPMSIGRNQSWIPSVLVFSWPHHGRLQLRADRRWRTDIQRAFACVGALHVSASLRFTSAVELLLQVL